MNRTIQRLKIVFLVLFAVGAAASWAYQFIYAIPKARCEGRGGWWDGDKRICGAPIFLPDLTGRPIGSPPAAEAAPEAPAADAAAEAPAAP